MNYYGQRSKQYAQQNGFFIKTIADRFFTITETHCKTSKGGIEK
tara:strand:+ start:584 stop:715 length:132 start_codon:yes stop_codon:yes gene_type:complete